jgi:hypothetical protein
MLALVRRLWLWLRSKARRCPTCNEDFVVDPETLWHERRGRPRQTYCGKKCKKYVYRKRYKKRCRQKAHEALDLLWKSGYMDRPTAYWYLCRVLGKTRKTGHISLLTEGECHALVRDLEKRFPRLMERRHRQPLDTRPRPANLPP